MLTSLIKLVREWTNSKIDSWQLAPPKQECIEWYATGTTQLSQH